MNTVTLSGTPRASVGKVDARELRAKGHVPCVIYGGKDQVHFHADVRAFKPIIFTPYAHIVEITVDGKLYKTVLQEAQFHRLSDILTHVDFLEIVDGKPVTANIPIKIVGQSDGVKKGGKLNLKLRKLKARGLAHVLPNEIELSIDKLELGDSIAVGDISIEGVVFLNAKNVSVVSVQSTRASVAEANAAPAKK